ncbi:Cytidylate kinase [Rhodothermus marinus SG0.5JP17-172]|uniref:(d)CMP kinase n=1 Tax=Rhodothermus marinus TaxID=29549 RepID=UPI000223D673|nr:(d)CMP kinase [Rhodothermus marinus]AEN73261.1 Cytidylate kinase [Rhodothermus marinus SG0.5JP17-172]MBO2491445.1 (d)CMP kinase [Rhodothermus marinus]
MIIAIDGPAGAGKSTTARRVAERLGYPYLDTGAMYRALALALLRQDPTLDPERAREALARVQLRVAWDNGRLRVFLDSEDVTEAIRTPEVSQAASRISAWPEVRARLLEEQRRIGRAWEQQYGGVVLDGRDIGTVVFPEAEVKVFLVADPEERARRRQRELAERGQEVPLEQVLAEILQRDAQDRQRAVAPLRKADDAVELDTTSLSIDEQVQRVYELVRERQRRLHV